MKNAAKRRWESKRRYYLVVLHQDLLGDYVIDRYWGGLFNQLGGHDTEYVSSLDHGLQVLDEIDKLRVSRKYQMVSSA